METQVVAIRTGSRHLTDLTSEAERFCAAAGAGEGLLSLFAPHATCGLALLELGSGSEADLEELMGRLLPRDDRYRHAHGAPGHGADHLLPVLVTPSMVVPVVDGRLALGTWQSLVLVDWNEDNPDRQVRFSYVGG